MEVANRFGVSVKSLYLLLPQAKERHGEGGQAVSLKDITARLKAKLKRTRRECDLLKKAPPTLQKSPGEL